MRDGQLSVTPEAGLLVVGHGSRREEANQTLRAVAGALAARGRWRAVQAAFLELLSPTIGEGYALLAAEGCSRVLVHPYFLFPGNHTARDIPAALVAAHRRHPGVPWSMTAPLGLHPALLDVVEQRICEALAPPDTGQVPMASPEPPTGRP